MTICLNMSKDGSSYLYTQLQDTMHHAMQIHRSLEIKLHSFQISPAEGDNYTTHWLWCSKGML